MCSICLEKFNNLKHLKVTCPFCDYNACKTCVQTYILSNTQDPHCMNCKHLWNREFIDSFCTKLFRNKDYKLHRENVLFEREKMRMPETQPYVMRKIERDSLRKSYNWLVELLNCVKVSDELERKTKIYLLSSLRTAVSDVFENLRVLTQTDIPVKSVTVTRKCPSVGCKGFLMDDYTCGVCVVKFCDKCHEPVGQDHVCDDDVVKTIKLLERDTKPCPSCSAPIYRVEGCAQMWCTQCHTAFDWRTGYVVTGRIHNPHYFEFKRRTREHGDIPCGGRPTYYELSTAGVSRDVLDILSVLINMDEELMYKYGYTYENNHRLRIYYMMNRLTDEEFKTHIQRRDKHNSKMRDIQNIYEMYINTSGDILRQCALDPGNESAFFEEIKCLTGYTNLVMEKIRGRYKSRVPHNIVLSN